MKKEHKYAQVLRWIADGEDVQARLPGSDVAGEFESLIGNFNSWNYSDDWRQCLLSGDFGGHEWQFRLKPRTITVNGREVPEPVMQPLYTGQSYFVPCLDTEELYLSGTWSGYDVSFRRLKRGLVHLTKEAAIAHAKAMLGID